MIQQQQPGQQDDKAFMNMEMYDDEDVDYGEEGEEMMDE